MAPIIFLLSSRTGKEFILFFRITFRISKAKSFSLQAINFLVLFVVLSFFLFFMCKKLNLFLDYKLEKHKRYSSKSKSYSIGGLLLLIYLL